MESDELGLVRADGDRPGPAERVATPKYRLALAVSGVAVVAIAFVALVAFGDRGSVESATTTAPPVTRPDRATSTATEASSATALTPGVGTRLVREAGAPLLSRSTGAILLATDFDGRVMAIDLDTGELVRSFVRTGQFVIFDGRFLVQTGCGGWAPVDLATFDVGDEVVPCGSYQPLAQIGAEVAAFARLSPFGIESVLVSDEAGGVTDLGLEPRAQVEVVFAIGRRVLLEVPGAGLLWYDGETGSTTAYADGRWLGGGSAGILWSTCDDELSCQAWFGTPDDPFVVALADLDGVDVEFGRVSPDGATAVLFGRGDGPVHVIDLATGQTTYRFDDDAPGLGTAWSPDGTWLFWPQDASVVALDVLSGDVIEFEAVPGDVSPGWLAVVTEP